VGTVVEFLDFVLPMSQAIVFQPEDFKDLPVPLPAVVQVKPEFTAHQFSPISVASLLFCIFRILDIVEVFIGFVS